VIVLDAQLVVAFLKNEPAAAEVEALLNGPERPRLTALGVAEVLDHLVRVLGADADDAALDLGQLGLANGIELDAGTGLRAARLRAAYHDREHRPVTLPRCVAAEIARADDAPLAAADRAILDVCHAEGIPVLALPDGEGLRWAPPRPTRRRG
jgi:predicted nucleic acid-binding protein